MSDVLFLEPVGTTNEVPSPSFEDPSNALDDYTGVDATLTRTLDEARFGRASAKIVTNGNLSAAGIFLTTDPDVAAEPRVASLYARGQGDVRMRVVDVTNGLTWTGEMVQLNSIFWQRIWLNIVLGSLVCTELRVYLETDDRVQIITFFTDGYQVENQPAITTYADGSLEDELDPHDGAPWFLWKGAKHNSQSTRDGRYRRAGRMRNITEGLHSELWPTNMTGLGMPRIRVNTETFTDLDRILVQQQRPLARAVTFTMWASFNYEYRITVAIV